jgi:hypothetical protein
MDSILLLPVFLGRFFFLIFLFWRYCSFVLFWFLLRIDVKDEGRRDQKTNGQASSPVMRESNQSHNHFRVGGPILLPLKRLVGV